MRGNKIAPAYLTIKLFLIAGLVRCSHKVTFTEYKYEHLHQVLPVETANKWVVGIAEHIPTLRQAPQSVSGRSRSLILGKINRLVI